MHPLARINGLAARLGGQRRHRDGAQAIPMQEQPQSVSDLVQQMAHMSAEELQMVARQATSCGQPQTLALTLTLTSCVRCKVEPNPTPTPNLN